MGLRQTEAKGVVGWIDQRLSIVDAYNTHLAQYWAPKNFNIWYFFGSLALLVLINQILKNTQKTNPNEYKKNDRTT